MASGTGTQAGWNALVAQLNIEFGDPRKRKDLAVDFKTKHGNKGDGKDHGTPYKFGRYVDKHNSLLSGESKKAQFAIDAGMRHWDPSLKLLEYAIKRSLVREAGGVPDPTKITFTPREDPSVGVTQAKAIIKDATNRELKTVEAIDAVIDTAGELKIEIICPPANLRPEP
jgi:hypothetical protein